MNAKTRQVAILGGNRIPFARSNGAYAHASNQDMLTAALDGLVDRFGLQGETLGEVAGGAVLKHSRDFNLDPRERARHPPRPRDARLRRPAGLRHRPGDDDPRRQQDRPRPDRLRHRRRRRHHLRRADRGQRGPARDPAGAQPRSARPTGKLRPWPASARARSCRRSRATRSPAPASRWASTRRSPRREWGIGRAEQDELARRQPPATSPPPTSAASSTT